MTRSPAKAVRPPQREPVTRERALSTALALADAEGIDSLTMRRLARELGIEAMSLYHHVASKGDILDGIVDLVMGEIEVPPTGTDWKTAMRHRAHSAHRVLLAHPWAATLVTSRINIGIGMTRYLEATFGRLMEGGFSVTDALDAWHALDSHIYGFTLQELTLPFDVDQTQQVSDAALASFDAAQFPHLVQVMTEVAQHGRVEDFDFGLDLLLDGLERRLNAA
jgi:AcrR family transcriptional regulator